MKKVNKSLLSELKGKYVSLSNKDQKKVQGGVSRVYNWSDGSWSYNWGGSGRCRWCDRKDNDTDY